MAERTGQESPWRALDPRLFELTTAGWVTQAISVAVRLGIPERLAAGPAGVGELSAAVTADEAALRRVLRVLAGVGLLEEREDGMVELTPLGRGLRRGVPGGLGAWALVTGSDHSRAAHSRLYETVTSGRPSGYPDWPDSLYGYLREHPADAALFNEAMVEYGSANLIPLAEYDFARHSVVADVGGGYGHVLGAVLARHPALQGLLVDQEPVLADAPAVLGRAGVEDRCTLVPGDFFAEVPGGADAYLLGNICHNWPDDDVRRILANVRAAVPEHGALLIVEPVLAGDADHNPFGRILDLVMLVATPGRERTVAELDGLLADTGFARTRMVSPEAFAPTLLVAEPV